MPLTPLLVRKVTLVLVFLTLCHPFAAATFGCPEDAELAETAEATEDRCLEEVDEQVMLQTAPLIPVARHQVSKCLHCLDDLPLELGEQDVEDDEDQALLQTTRPSRAEHREVRRPAPATPYAVQQSNAASQADPSRGVASALLETAGGVDGPGASNEDEAFLQLSSIARGENKVARHLAATAGQPENPGTPGGLGHGRLPSLAGRLPRAPQGYAPMASSTTILQSAGQQSESPVKQPTRDLDLDIRVTFQVRLLQAVTMVVVLACICLAVWPLQTKKDVPTSSPQLCCHEEDAVVPVGEEKLRPLPRLTNVGTSFVVPLSQIRRSKVCDLCVEIPASPALWPLRATLSRQSEVDPWQRIDLTVDIIDAAGLPPLLSCGFSGADLGHESGDTGATSQWDKAYSNQLTPADGCLWCEVRGGAGPLAALVTRTSETTFVVHRDGHFSWDFEAHLVGDVQWLRATRRGHHVGLATRLVRSLSGKDDEMPEEYMQIDTQPDTSSPESMLLLICMLAIMVLGPQDK